VTQYKLYYRLGQRKLMAWFHPRWQLEQYFECRCVQFESEQYAHEYQYQYRVSGRQELQSPPESLFFYFWLQELWLITVATSVQDDLPFVLSQPVCVFFTLWLKRRVGGESFVDTNFRPRRSLAFACG